MQFKKNAQVFTADGREVGAVSYVVLEPGSKAVTHVVVQKGILFKEDKVVPLSLIGSAAEARVVLRQDAGDLQALPDFEEFHYVPTEGDEDPTLDPKIYAPPYYWYPPVGLMGMSPYGFDDLRPRYVVETETNIPPGTVALAEGAQVISLDDKHVGNVEQVLTEPGSDRATHFIISQGLLLKTRKLIPTAWIQDITRNEVHLAVGSAFLERLREYHVPETV